MPKAEGGHQTEQGTFTIHSCENNRWNNLIKNLSEFTITVIPILLSIGA